MNDEVQVAEGLVVDDRNTDGPQRHVGEERDGDEGRRAILTSFWKGHGSRSAQRIAASS